MAIRSILAPISGYEVDSVALASGMRLARRLGAYVDVIHVQPDPKDMVPPLTINDIGSIMERAISEVTKDIEARAGRAKLLYEEACKGAKFITSGPGAQASFRILGGRSADALPVMARVSDLILFSRVPEAVEAEWRLTLEALLLESGRPVLLMPKAPVEPIGDSVAVAWNGSVEAAHAASAALPLLGLARRVLLLSGSKGAPLEPSLDDVGVWLERHGVLAERKHVRLKAWPIGEQLVDEAANEGADLLVMGAYGHTRMRETIFGGATRAVLNECRLPVLLAH
ncbi:MAG TPA: universal stress protein [Alphaproteobacteria bacterium]|nr:universal stress protein [Alphaproteobacteria bacterium]